MHCRIKICGITNLEDAKAAIELGADALGFVFYPPSPRHIELQMAAEISHQLPPFISTTALFVDASRQQIEMVLNTARMDCLQFHGNESAADCEGYNRPWIKALRMKAGINLIEQHQIYSNASALLLDTYVKGIAGGTGEKFQWQLIPENLRSEIILAGGLTVENVYQAVKTVKPWAVDVSGGVEKEKGMKDHVKIAQFIKEVRAGES